MVTRVEYQNEMANLHEELIRMGAAVENAIDEAITALAEMDCARAGKVIEQDDIVDAMERKIDQHCVEIIARQQPVASDLRDVTSILKLITDLERIADHASDICERILAICSHENRIAVPYDIINIISLAKSMLRGALDSYIARDEEQASKVIDTDTRVDELYERTKANLIHLMSVDTVNIDQLVELLLISKYVERIADHAQNVAEWVIYFIKGRYVSHGPPDL
jgi:phosphate transport system protein